MSRLLRFIGILARTRSFTFVAAAARQRASGQLLNFLAAGGNIVQGALVWGHTRLGGSGFDFRALPDVVAMIDAGVTIAPASSGWYVSFPEGPVFRFDDADLYGGLGVLKERFLENEFSGFSVAGVVVLDIGAHFGDSAVWFATHGASRVLAYEPFPHNAEVAAESIRLNGLDGRVELELAGVGAESAHLQVPYDRMLSVIQTVRLGSDAPGNGQATEVDLIPFAAAVARASGERSSEKIAVKIDCEGCEEDIFAASESWIALESVDRLVIEWHRRETLDPFVVRLRAASFDVQARPTDDHTYIVLADRRQSVARET